MTTTFVDVSSFQGTSLAYFEGLKKLGITNAIVKATEGDFYTNNGAQFGNAIKAFDTVGLYHFLHGDPVIEANIFIKTIENWGAEKDTLVVVDVEAPDIENKNVTGLTNQWINTVYDAGYHNIMVYANEDWFNSVLSINKLAHRPKIWVAKYSTVKPSVARYDAWQFTNNYKGLKVDASYNFNDIFATPDKPKYWSDGSLFELKTGLHVYKTLDISDKNNRRRNYLGKWTRIYGEPVKNGSIYTLKTDVGYISANKEYVQKIEYK